MATPTDTVEIDLPSFEAQCRDDIPLLNAMQLTFTEYRDLSLTLDAPLAPNINNKGTAFGGSIGSICLMGGWAVSTLAFMERGIDNTEIVVYRNEMTFERPAVGHLTMRASLDHEEFAACLTKLREPDAGKERLHINAELFHGDKRCARMKGLYVVWLK